MRIKDWFQWLQAKSDQRRRTRAQAVRRALRAEIEFRPTLARLEDRRVLSVSVGLEAGVAGSPPPAAADAPLAPPLTVYVDEDWAGTAAGDSPTASDPGAGLIFGYDAFDTIQGGIDGVAFGGTVVVYGNDSGYGEAVTVDKPLSAIVAATNPAISGETTVTISGAVTLGEHARFTSDSSLNDLNFAATVDSAAGELSDLEIDTGAAAVSFNGNLGTAQPLGALTVNNARQVVFGSTDAVTTVRAQGPVNLGSDGAIADGIILNGGSGGQFQLITSGTAVRFNGPVVLYSDAAISTNGDGDQRGLPGDITFTAVGTIDSRTAEHHGLVLRAGAGSITFNANLGEVQPLQSLVVESTTGPGSVVFGGADSPLPGSSAGPVTLVRTVGDIDLGRGAEDNDRIGGGLADADTVDNGSFETGDFTGWSTTIPPGGSAEAVSLYVADLGTGPTYTAVDGTQFAVLKTDGPGSFTTASQTFYVQAGQTISGYAFFDTTDYLPYDDNAQVAIKSGDTVLAVVFQANVSSVGDFGQTPWVAWEYTVPFSGAFTVEARVTNAIDGASDSRLGLDGISGGGSGSGQRGGIVLNGGDSPIVFSTSSGSLRFNGPVMLSSDAVMVADDPVVGSVRFTEAGTIDSESGEANDLTVDAEWTAFQAAVGGMQPLNNLTTNADGTTDINGGSVTTLQDQTYGDAVVLTADTVLAGNDVRFEQTVDGDGLGPWNLEVNSTDSGVTVFDGAVGSLHALNNLTTDADGMTDVNGGSVTTVQDQAYGDAVVLTADAVLTGNNIRFGQSVDGDGQGPWNLDVNSTGGGLTVFDGAVGSLHALDHLTTNADGTTDINGGSVTTVQDQTYGDAVLLTADAVLTGNDVRFGQSVDGDGQGPWNLEVNSTGGGLTVFAGPVGSQHALNNLTTNADGTTDINGVSVTTVQDQTYGDTVVLTADAVLTGKNLTFENTVDGDDNGPWDLTLDAAAGDILFAGAVGADGGLDELTIVHARDVTAWSSVQTARLVQESGTGTTTFHDMVSVTGQNGIALTTGSVIFDGHVSTLNANGPLSVKAAHDIQINALIETGSGSVDLVAGGDVSMSPTGQIATTGAEVNITADGSLLMSDGAIVDSGAGTIRVSADEGITVGRFVSGTLVVLNSAGGPIQDAGDSGGADIESPLLALRAVGGIGAGNSLETEVQTIAADNDNSGGIQVANQGPLTIGTVDDLAGLTNRGHGVLAVANEGEMLVGDPVLNVGGGDTLLMANGGTLTVGATITHDVAGNARGGSITLQAEEDVVIQHDVITNGGQWNGGDADQGVIRVEAGGHIQLDPGVTIATGTGKMTASPAPEDMPPPVDVRLVPVDQGGSNVNSQGDAFIDVTVFDAGLTNYQVEADWADGFEPLWTHLVTYPPEQSIAEPEPGDFLTGRTYRFYFSYAGKGNPDVLNPSAPIPVKVTIRYDGRVDGNGRPLNGIVFKEGGQVLATSLSDVLTVPGTGLFAAIKVVKSEIVPVALRQAPVTVPILSQAAGGSQQTSLYDAPAAELESVAREGLRIFFRRVDATGQEGEDVELPPELLERGLSEVFQRFSNGRYRIYLKEANSDRERMIQELNVYQGRIMPPDFRDDAGERQVGEESDPPKEQSSAGQPAAENGDAPQAPASKPAEPKAEGGPDAAESVQPAATAATVGGAAIALGLAGNGNSPLSADQIDRAFQAERRSLSHAARLSRRLRLGNANR